MGDGYVRKGGYDPNFIVRVFCKTTEVLDWDVYKRSWDSTVAIFDRDFTGDNKLREDLISGMYLRDIENEDTRLWNLKWAIRKDDVLHGKKRYAYANRLTWRSDTHTVERFTPTGFRVRIGGTSTRRDLRLDDLGGLQIQYKDK